MASEVKTNKVSPATGSTTEVTGLITSTSDARGDVLYHDGTNFTRLEKPGTPAGEVLTFSTSASDPAWVASAAGGMILEVLGATLDTTISTTSTSYITTGLSIDITPDSTSSRFLLIVSGGEQGSNTANQEVHTTFYVDGSEVSPAGPYETSRTVNHSAYQTVYGPHSAFCLHSPSTVSEVTYAVFYKASSGTANFNVTATRVQFTVMELSS